jgi:ABC-type molybdate transport system substrate-binding protein
VELTSGTNVLQTIDFAPGCTSCGQGEFNVTVSTANQAPSGSYTLSVFDESTAASPTTDTPTLAVSNVVGDFATNLSATGGATPTFTWLYPVNNTTAYTYQLTLWDANGNVVSQVPATTGTGFPSTTPNSITPSVTLNSSVTYTWAITTIDSNGNTAQQKATYQP